MSVDHRFPRFLGTVEDSHFFMRTLIAIPFCAALPGFISSPTFAQTYPSKPIRFVVPFTAGGGADTMARLVGSKVGAHLGQQLVIENRGAAGGTVGTGLAAKAASDGYTILLTAANIAAAVSLFDKLTFDPLKDFVPVTLLAKTPSIVAVHPSLPVKSVRELIGLAKAHPGTINYAGGVGSLLHLDVEYFKAMAKIDLVQVPYNGSGPSMIGVVSGEASIVISPTTLVLPHAQNGRLRALAITSKERFAALPDLPTVAESGLPDFNTQQWYGILLPGGTSKPIVTRLHGEFVKAMQSPEITQRMISDASVAVGSTPDEFADFFREDIAKWAKVVKFSGARAH
jgi:tripartite-type tricarboxylate transporter receptor subunit TctC